MELDLRHFFYLAVFTVMKGFLNRITTTILKFSISVVLFLWIVPLENFSLIWRRHHFWWRAANFDLCSTLKAIEQWGFFNVPHLLWHGTTLYKGYLRGPVTFTPVAKRLAVELSPPLFTTQVCRERGSNPDLSHARRTLYFQYL